MAFKWLLTKGLGLSPGSVKWIITKGLGIGDGTAIVIPHDNIICDSFFRRSLPVSSNFSPSISEDSAFSSHSISISSNFRRTITISSLFGD